MASRVPISSDELKAHSFVDAFDPLLSAVPVATYIFPMAFHVEDNVLCFEARFLIQNDIPFTVPSLDCLFELIWGAGDSKSAQLQIKRIPRMLHSWSNDEFY